MRNCSRLRSMAGAFLIGMLLAGCGGGGSSSVQAVPAAAGAAKGQTAPLNINLNVPVSRAGGSKRRSPRFISPETQSADIAVGAQAPVTLNVGAASASCAVNAQITETLAFAGAQPMQLAPASDGTMWYVADSGSSTRQLLPGGLPGKQVANQGELTTSIGADSDGSVWVGHVYGDPSYFVQHVVGTSITDVNITPTNYVSSLAHGTDGAMYLSYQKNDATFAPLTTIGRIAAGVYEADHGTASSGIIRLKTGTDGRIWFNETNGTVGWMQAGASYTFAEYGAPMAGTFGAFPSGIAVAPDNSVYYLQVDAANHASLAHVSASGSVLTPIALPTSISSNITALAYGPDGAIWMAEYSDQKIGRVTTAGVYSDYPVASAAGPIDIAVGSDNQVYFVERDANNYGTVALSYACGAAVLAPVGSTNVSVKTYDAPGGASGGGHLLSSATTPVTIVANGMNNLSVVLSGIVDHVVLTSSTNRYGAGCSPPYTSSLTVSAQAIDSVGDIILGSGVTDAAGNPLQVQLSFSDPGATDSASPATLTWPNPTSNVNISSPNNSMSLGGASVGSPPAALPNALGASAPISTIPMSSSGNSC